MQLRVTATKAAPNKKTLPFLEFKALDDQRGTFEGYLAVFNNVDLGGDLIEPGAFKKTLSELEQKRRQRGGDALLPILWQHNPHEPIGKFTEMREDAKGLYVKGELDLDIEQGRRAYSGLKKGYLRGLSIGFDTIKDQWQGNVRRLKEVRLWEGSIVTWPMNPEANVESVKAVSGKTTWPLAEMDREWDSAAAHKRLVEWAKDENGNIDPAKFRQVHFWYDAENAENITAYKLPFCDVIDGEVKAVPRAIFAVAAALQGARGGVDIPEADKEKIRRRVETYYARMRDEFDDDSIVVPWAKGEKAADFATALAKVQVEDDLIRKWWTIWNTIQEVVQQTLSDPGVEDKVSAISQSLDQFKKELLSWVIQADEAGLWNDEAKAEETERLLKSAVNPELKVGRVLSAANRQKLIDAITALSGAVEIIKALLDETEPDPMLKLSSTPKDDKGAFSIGEPGRIGNDGTTPEQKGGQGEPVKTTPIEAEQLSELLNLIRKWAENKKSRKE